MKLRNTQEISRLVINLKISAFTDAARPARCVHNIFFRPSLINSLTPVLCFLVLLPNSCYTETMFHSSEFLTQKRKLSTLYIFISLTYIGAMMSIVFSNFEKLQMLIQCPGWKFIPKLKKGILWHKHIFFNPWKSTVFYAKVTIFNLLISVNQYNNLTIYDNTHYSSKMSRNHYIYFSNLVSCRSNNNEPKVFWSSTKITMLVKKNHLKVKILHQETTKSSWNSSDLAVT